MFVFFHSQWIHYYFIFSQEENTSGIILKEEMVLINYCPQFPFFLSFISEKLHVSKENKKEPAVTILLGQGSCMYCQYISIDYFYSWKPWPRPSFSPQNWQKEKSRLRNKTFFSKFVQKLVWRIIVSMICDKSKNVHIGNLVGIN